VRARVVVIALVAGVGCRNVLPPQSDSGSPATTDAVDTGTEPPSTDPAHGSCDALVAPMGITDLASAEDALRLGWPDASTPFDAADRAFSTGGSCPQVTADDAGNETATGPCTTSAGWTFDGAVSERDTSSGRFVTYDHFHVSYAGADGGYDWQGDGLANDVTESSGNENLVFKLYYAATRSGAYTPGKGGLGGAHDGSYYRDQTWRITAMNGHVAIDGYTESYGDGGLPAGDVCATGGLDPVGACGVEDDGTVSVTGGGTADLAFDAGDLCDGCGTLSVNGAAAGTFCLGD
jgi:hypothetical protein